MALSRDFGLSGPLNTVLGIEDLEDIIEVIAIDAHNARAFAKKK